MIKLRSNTVQILTEFNTQSLVTHAKKREQMVAMMPPIKKAFDLLRDDTGELSTENESMKNKRGSYVEKWLEESEVRLLEQFDDNKRANLIMSKVGKPI